MPIHTHRHHVWIINDEYLPASIVAKARSDIKSGDLRRAVLAKTLLLALKDCDRVKDYNPSQTGRCPGS